MGADRRASSRGDAVSVVVARRPGGRPRRPDRPRRAGEEEARRDPGCVSVPAALLDRSERTAPPAWTRSRACDAGKSCRVPQHAAVRPARVQPEPHVVSAGRLATRPTGSGHPFLPGEAHRDAAKTRGRIRHAFAQAAVSGRGVLRPLRLGEAQSAVCLGRKHPRPAAAGGALPAHGGVLTGPRGVCCVPVRSSSNPGQVRSRRSRLSTASIARSGHPVRRPQEHRPGRRAGQRHDLPRAPRASRVSGRHRLPPPESEPQRQLGRPRAAAGDLR